MCRAALTLDARAGEGSSLLVLRHVRQETAKPFPSEPEGLAGSVIGAGFMGTAAPR